MPTLKKKPLENPAPAQGPSRTATLLWLALGLLAIPVRFWLWQKSIGSNDVNIWLEHAHRVTEQGLVHTYVNFPMFNHPPLAGLYSTWALAWSGPNAWTFGQLLKLPGIAGEILTLIALWRFAGPAAFASYAWIPAAVLVSSYHGNTDALCVAFILLAGIAFDRGRFFLAALLFGAALNVKVLPVLLLPLLLAQIRSRKAALHITAGLALMALPFVPSLLEAAPEMYRNMFKYNSNPDHWGFVAFLNDGVNTPEIAPQVTPLRDWYLAKGRYVLLAGIAALAFLSLFRRLRLSDQFAMGAAVFLIFAPGFGVQYVIYAAPLLMLYSVTAGNFWGWTAGAFIGMVYWTYLNPLRPLHSVIFKGFPGPAPLFGIIAWVVLIYYLWHYLVRVWRAPFDAAPWIPSKAADILRYLNSHGRPTQAH